MPPDYLRGLVLNGLAGIGIRYGDKEAFAPEYAVEAWKDNIELDGLLRPVSIHPEAPRYAHHQGGHDAGCLPQQYPQEQLSKHITNLISNCRVTHGFGWLLEAEVLTVSTTTVVASEGLGTSCVFFSREDDRVSVTASTSFHRRLIVMTRNPSAPATFFSMFL